MPILLEGEYAAVGVKQSRKSRYVNISLLLETVSFDVWLSMGHGGSYLYTVRGWLPQ